MRENKGFTLIELLVVVAIIGILAAVGVVAYSGYTSAAKEKALRSIHKNLVNMIINNNLNLSISKKLQRVAKKRAMQRKEDEKLDPELESLFDQLQMVRENERLALVANKLNQENQAMKELIIQLIKENQKIKTENKLLIQNINSNN